MSSIRNLQLKHGSTHLKTPKKRKLKVKETLKKQRDIQKKQITCQTQSTPNRRCALPRDNTGEKNTNETPKKKQLHVRAYQIAIVLFQKTSS